MPRSSDAKTRFVQTAARLFQERGFCAVGLTETIDASGAPKGSFYHHFPGGKEELAEEAVRMSAAFIARIIDASFDDAPSFESGAVALGDALAALFEKSGFRAGCPLASIALEMTPESLRLSSSVRLAMESWVDAVTRHGKRLGCIDAAERAERLMIALEGGWIVARVRRATDPIRVAARMA